MRRILAEEKPRWEFAALCKFDFVGRESAFDWNLPEEICSFHGRGKGI